MTEVSHSCKTTEPLLRLGDRLGAFVVNKALGIGRRGRVFLAQHHSLEYPVLIKVHTEETEAESDREVRALRGMNGDGTPALLLAGRLAGSGLPYLVMDFLPGECLSRVLQAHRRLDAARVVDLGLQLLTIARRLHELGYVHCDIKPDNIMLSLDTSGFERVSLLDYGAVHLMDLPNIEYAGVTSFVELSQRSKSTLVF